MIYFTSDTHFGHRNIIEYCNRPFKDVEEMDREIINNINSMVKHDDTLYHLGDFSFNVGKYRALINCKNIILVLGNHDKYKYARGYFNAISEYLKIVVNNKKIILCHYPFAKWDCSHHGSYHLFGHCHGNHNKWIEEHMPHGLLMDVGVDCNDFKPISIYKVIETMESKNFKNE